VLLVSRAIALLQILVALNDSLVNLPVQVFVLSQRMRLGHAFPGAHVALLPIEWTGIISSLAHITVLLVAAVLFWRCGPMIERLLLPASGTNEQAAERI